MRLLHFRRTFVEKMFAIHAKVEAFKKAGKEIGGYARHYYDLYCLAERPEVLAMLRSDEYGEIKADYDRISRQHFEKSYVAPPDMSFAKSDALFPPADLRGMIAGEFRGAVPRAVLWAVSELGRCAGSSGGIPQAAVGRGGDRYEDGHVSRCPSTIAMRIAIPSANFAG